MKFGDQIAPAVGSGPQLRIKFPHADSLDRQSATPYIHDPRDCGPAQDSEETFRIQRTLRNGDRVDRPEVLGEELVLVLCAQTRRGPREATERITSAFRVRVVAGEHVEIGA